MTFSFNVVFDMTFQSEAIFSEETCQVTRAKTSAGARRAAVLFCPVSFLFRTKLQCMTLCRVSSLMLGATKATISQSYRRCLTGSITPVPVLARLHLPFMHSRLCLKIANLLSRSEFSSISFIRCCFDRCNLLPCPQTPHVVKFSKQVRLHCVALGDADGTVRCSMSHFPNARSPDSTDVHYEFRFFSGGI